MFFVNICFKKKKTFFIDSQDNVKSFSQRLQETFYETLPSLQIDTYLPDNAQECLSNTVKCLISVVWEKSDKKWSCTVFITQIWKSKIRQGEEKIQDHIA